MHKPRQSYLKYDLPVLYKVFKLGRGKKWINKTSAPVAKVLQVPVLCAVVK